MGRDEERLPTGRLSRQVRAVIAGAEELAPFARSLEEKRDVDPADPVVASGLGSLYARLRRVVADSQAARDTVAYYVRAGREKASADAVTAEEREIAERLGESA